jgi:hypothetical protein
MMAFAKEPWGVQRLEVLDPEKDSYTSDGLDFLQHGGYSSKGKSQDEDRPQPQCPFHAS